ncbi:MAG TPA: hypothetical protein V6C90_15385 [Coleofasciculaceae cyanobacterium]|jgi:hypothetical protein
MASKRRELRIIAEPELWEILEAMQTECGFTCASGAVKNLIKVHGTAEVQRARLMRQGIYPAAAPIAAGMVQTMSIPQTQALAMVEQPTKPEPPAPVLVPPRPKAASSTGGAKAIASLLKSNGGTP